MKTFPLKTGLSPVLPLTLALALTVATGLHAQPQLTAAKVATLTPLDHTNLPVGGTY